MRKSLFRAALAAATSLLLASGAQAATTHHPAAHGKPPRAYVMTMHGGAWYRVGPRMAARMDADGARLNSWGYAAVNVDYRAGARSFTDVLAVYDRLRARVGPHVPICAYGASAGGHLALMLALKRPALACVVAKAPPTLLAQLPPWLRRIATRFFGPAGGLEAWSPALHPLRTPLLLEQARADRIVGFAQSLAMHAADSNSRLIPFRPGSAPFIHAPVNARELAAAHAAERRFLARRTAAWSPPGLVPAPRQP